MTGYFDAAPRPPTSADAEAIRALVWGVLGVTPYVDRVSELVAATERGDPDALSLVVERDGTAAALAIFGPIAGTRDTWQLRTLLIAPEIALREVGRPLIDAVGDQARRRGGRLLVAEMPADPVLGRSLTLLRASGFKQDGRIPDFYRDGVALLFLRRDL